jgi:transposase-like protein
MEFEIIELATYITKQKNNYKMSIDCPYGSENVDLSVKKLPVNEKLWFVQQLKESKTSVTRLNKEYNISVNTLRSWLRRFKSRGYLCLDDGRPALISNEVQKKVLNIVSKAKYRLQQSAVLDIVEDLRSYEAVTAGTSPNSLDTVSQKPITEAQSRAYGARNQVRGEHDEARAKATASIQNAMSYHAMTRYVSVVLNVRCAKNINSDGSSFTVGTQTRNARKLWSSKWSLVRLNVRKT